MSLEALKSTIADIGSRPMLSMACPKQTIGDLVKACFNESPKNTNIANNTASTKIFSPNYEFSEYA